MNTIPQQATDWLMSDPTPANKMAFDKRFGEGQAARLVEEVNNPQPDIEVESKSWWDYTKAVAGDVAEGVLEAPTSIAGGLYDGVVRNPADFMASTFGDIRIYNERNGEFFDYISPEEYNAEKKAVREGALEPTYTENLSKQFATMGEDTFTGKFVNDASQFFGAYAGLGKVLKSSTKLVEGARIAGSTFLAYQGNEGRITDMLLSMGVPDEMLPDFLETDPNDSEAMGRLKNVIEEGPIGALGVLAVKVYRAARTGDKAGVQAVIKEAEKAAETTKAKIGERIEAEVDTPKADEAAPAAPESPVLKPDADDVKSAKPDDQFPDKKEGFALTSNQFNRIDKMAEKLANDPDANVTGNMGWRSPHLISSPDAVEAEIVAVRTVMADKFKAKNTPRKLENIEKSAAKRAAKLAELTGASADEVLKATKKFDNPNTMAADLMARENYALTLTENVVELAKALRHHRDTGDFAALQKLGFKSVEEARMGIVAQRELAGNLLAQVQGQRSNIGRAMRAMQMTRKGDPEMMKLIRANQDGLTQSADEIVDAIDGAAAGGKSPLDAVVNGGKLMKKAGDAINTYRINALLSGVGTQEVNMISNAINMFALPTQQLAGGLVSANGQQIRHALNTYRGIFGGSLESVKTALRAGYNDEAILDPFNAKIDTAPQTASAKNVAGKIIQSPSRFLLTADEFFKQAQYRGRVFADAVDAAKRAPEVKSGKMTEKEYLDKYIENSFDENGGATRGQALLQAQRSTFTENLDGPMSKMIQQAAIKSNAVRYVIPFVRTPLNILSQGFQQMPAVGFLSKRLREDIAAGGPRRAQAYGKQVLGTAITYIGLQFVAHDVITGSGPKDPRVRAQWLKNNKPYSFRFVDKETGEVKFVPYQRYEPAAYVLSLMADFGEIVKYGDETSRVEKSEMAAAIVAAVAENTVNKTFTQGLADIFELLTDTERAMENWLEAQAGSFVPNIIPQALSEEEKVEIRGVMDSLQARTGMTSTMDRKRNAMGEVDLNYGNKMDPMGLFVPDVRKVDIVQEELTRLAQAHQSGFGAPPPRMGEVDLRKETYKGDQSIYDRWQELTGEIKVGGKTLRQRLEKTIQSRSYKRLSDGNRDFTGENEKILKKIITQYREVAKKTLMKENPKFKQIFIDMETSKRLVKRRNSNTLIEDIINGPR